MKWNVALFSNVYLPSTNGVARSVKTFQDGLSSLGHNVFVFCPDANDYNDTDRFIFRYPAFEMESTKYPLTLPVSNTVDQVLPIIKPDIIHANHPALLGRVAEVKSRELDIPLVFTYHTRYRDYAHYGSFLPKDALNSFIEEWMASFMTSCHHVIVPSGSIKTMLSDTYGVDDQVSVLPTGIDTEVFGVLTQEEARTSLGLDPDHIILTSVGRMAPEKNFELLLQAVSKSDHFDKLYLLGDGESLDDLRKLARDLGIGEKVEFLGRVSPEQVRSYVTAADMFVFASVTETQGIVTLEAMACGTPVVAVEASGTSDMVRSGQHGILTEVNATALSEGINTLLENEVERREMGEMAKNRAQEFDKSTQAKKLLEVYEKARVSKNLNKFAVEKNPDRESNMKQFLDFFRV